MNVNAAGSRDSLAEWHATCSAVASGSASSRESATSRCR